MNLRRGQKVVCIDDQFPDWINELYDALPKEGEVYVIRGLACGVTVGPNRTEGEVAVYLVGLVNPRNDKPPHMERGFHERRFRPLDEIKDQEKRSEKDKLTFVGSSVNS